MKVFVSHSKVFSFGEKIKRIPVLHMCSLHENKIKSPATMISTTIQLTQTSSLVPFGLFDTATVHTGLDHIQTN